MPSVLRNWYSPRLGHSPALSCLPVPPIHLSNLSHTLRSDFVRSLTTFNHLRIYPHSPISTSCALNLHFQLPIDHFSQKGPGRQIHWSAIQLWPVAPEHIPSTLSFLWSFRDLSQNLRIFPHIQSVTETGPSLQYSFLLLPLLLLTLQINLPSISIPVINLPN